MMVFKWAPLQIWAFWGLGLRSWTQVLLDKIECKSACFGFFARIIRRKMFSWFLYHTITSVMLWLVTKCTLGLDNCGPWLFSFTFCQANLPTPSCDPVSFWNHVFRALKVFLLSWQEHRQATSPYSGAFPWTRKSNLDYLALDFNSASPSPVQKVGVTWKTWQPFCLLGGNPDPGLHSARCPECPDEASHVSSWLYLCQAPD